MEIQDEELFLFDRIWFPKVFLMAREAGLDWLRMCAAAEVLSNGDPRVRVTDWEFIHTRMGLDNPVYVLFYDEEENPSIELVDRGTRWGLFQIHGEMAVQHGYTGRLVNLIDITKNIQVACHIISQQIKTCERLEVPVQLPQAAEAAMGWPVDKIDQKVAELKEQLHGLLTFGE